MEYELYERVEFVQRGVILPVKDLGVKPTPKHTVVDSDNSDYEFMFETGGAGKFYFSGKGSKEDVDFLCQISGKGDIVIHDDRDRSQMTFRKWYNKVSNSVTGMKSYRSVENDGFTVKEYRIIDTSEESNIIRRQIEFNLSTMRYQYYENGDISICRKKGFGFIAMLPMPKVFAPDGTELRVNSHNIVREGSNHFIETVINPVDFNAYDWILLDPDFTISTTAEFDAGTHTDTYAFDDQLYLAMEDTTFDYIDEGCETLEGTDDIEPSTDPTWAPLGMDANHYIKDNGDDGGIPLGNFKFYSASKNTRMYMWADVGALPDSLTFETRIKVTDNSHDTTGAYPYFWKTFLYTGTHYVDIEIRSQGSGDVFDVWYRENGGTSADTGLDLELPIGEWHTIRLIVDGSGTQWTGKLFLDGIYIGAITDGDDSAGANDGRVYVFIASPAADTNEFYLDTIRVHQSLLDTEGLGNWESAVQTMSVDQVLNTTIYHTGLSATYKITDQQWLVGGLIKARRTEDIISGGSTLTEEGDLTSGTFADVNDDFTYKVYFASGDGASTPIITQIEGDYLAAYTVEGVTVDAAGNPLGSCVVKLYKTSDDSYEDSTTSHASTGAYSFGMSDTDSRYVIAYKTGTPVFGTTDDLTPS